jgi:hypothetical protein
MYLKEILTSDSNFSLLGSHLYGKMVEMEIEIKREQEGQRDEER